MPEFADDADVVARKSAVRATLLARRRSLAASTREDASDAVVREVLSLVRRLGARRVCAYTPFGTEPGGSALLPALRSMGVSVLLPVLLDSKDLAWSLDSSPLDVSAVASADLVLVPGLAVDRRGVRLGRGGGSYDRALARVTSAPAVVLLHDGEIVDSLPSSAHDRAVDGAITPGSGLVWFRRLDELGRTTHH